MTDKIRPDSLSPANTYLDTQVALHGRHFPDLVVNAVSPEPPLLSRRASMFCKAPLKKPASNVFASSTRFKSRTWLRSSRTGDVALPPSPAPQLAAASDTAPCDELPAPPPMSWNRGSSELATSDPSLSITCVRAPLGRGDRRDGSCGSVG
jgi:hypothetical protein